MQPCPNYHEHFPALALTLNAGLGQKMIFTIEMKITVVNEKVTWPRLGDNSLYQAEIIHWSTLHFSGGEGFPVFSLAFTLPLRTLGHMPPPTSFFRGFGDSARSPMAHDIQTLSWICSMFRFNLPHSRDTVQHASFRWANAVDRVSL